MNEEAISINGQQAAILHAALGQAIESTREQMRLKSAAPFRSALSIQLSGYETERTRIAETFPELRDAVAE